MVGDTDQNIYSWRGRILKHYDFFEKDFPGTKVILLEENYRSTGNILSLANNAIKKNTVRKEKNLFTRSGAGEEIEILPSFDEESEAEWVAKKAKRVDLEWGETKSNRSSIQNQFPITHNGRDDVAQRCALYSSRYQILRKKRGKRYFELFEGGTQSKSQPDLKRVFDTPKKG